jgi:NAD/NADP transhydrogenase alpha subunit
MARAGIAALAIIATATIGGFSRIGTGYDTHADNRQSKNKNGGQPGVNV